MAGAFQSSGFQRSAFQSDSLLVAVSAVNLTYPVNCVMEILKRDVAPSDGKLNLALFKSIFNEK